MLAKCAPVMPVTAAPERHPCVRNGRFSDSPAGVHARWRHHESESFENPSRNQRPMPCLAK